MIAGVVSLIVLAGTLLHAEIVAQSEIQSWDAAGARSLIKLVPTKTEVGFWQLLAGEHPEKREVAIEEKPRTDYLLAHAPSRVEYDIPAGATGFKALGLSTSNQSCAFSVAVDGEVVFTSTSLETYSHGVVDIKVMLPKDGKKLALVTTPVGDFHGCQTCWVEPGFVNLPGFGQTLPVARTVVDSAGRKLEVTLLERTATAIRAMRVSDGVEFTLELATLSADDQAFIAGLQERRETAVTATAEPVGDDPDNGFPAGFKFDKSLIEPGKRVFLALPFTQQEKGGICTAASMLNILQYLDPTLQLSQKELFALFNNRTSGASLSEMQAGLRTLGYRGTLVTTDIKKDELMPRVYSALNNGKPILAGKRGHEITLIGYNKAKGTLILWDQRMPDMKDSHGMPVGSFELSEVAFRSRIVDLIFILPEPAAPADVALLIRTRELAGIKGMLLAHPIYNANTREETLTDFLRHAAEPRIAVSLRKKHRVFVPDEKEILEIIAEPKDGGWECITHPGGKTEKISRNRILKLIEEAEGNLYSLPPAKAL